MKVTGNIVQLKVTGSITQKGVIGSMTQKCVSGSISEGGYVAPAGPSYPAVIDDGNTVGWFDHLENITKDDSNFVSVWGDKSGLAHHLLQATGTNQPLWSANGVLFDGIDNFMKCVGFEWNQPEFIYIVFKQVTWTSLDLCLDGNAYQSGTLMQSPSPSPNIRFYGGFYSETITGLSLDTWGIIRVLINGIASKIILNNDAPKTGNFGTNNMSGFTLGRGAAGAAYANIEVKEIILRNVVDTPADEAAIYAYLAAKYSI